MSDEKEYVVVVLVSKRRLEQSPSIAIAVAKGTNIARDVAVILITTVLIK